MHYRFLVALATLSAAVETGPLPSGALGPTKWLRLDLKWLLSPKDVPAPELQAAHLTLRDVQFSDLHMMWQRIVGWLGVLCTMVLHSRLSDAAGAGAPPTPLARIPKQGSVRVCTCVGSCAAYDCLSSCPPLPFPPTPCPLTRPLKSPIYTSPSTIAGAPRRLR